MEDSALSENSTLSTFPPFLSVRLVRDGDVVFVNPMDAKERYWWPAMVHYKIQIKF